VPNLYDLLGAPDAESVAAGDAATPPPKPPKPGSTLTAAVETTDADRAAMLLGAIGL
jgi:hypothetical protein